MQFIDSHKSPGFKRNRALIEFAVLFTLLFLFCLPPKAHSAGTRPYDGGKFVGRIAYSADGNHNDRDDWMASPVALAIFAEAGVKDRVVHFDYNCILPQTDPVWESIHAQSVLGAVERYGYDPTHFIDCRKNLDGALDDIAKAINDSSADNPLYFIVAGPMEVPYLGIQKSDPARRKYVYCISHSRWNDGFASKYKFTHTKRSVIEQGVNWLQIPDQNKLLSLSKYGQPAKPEEFAGFYWMRDSKDSKVKFLWERTLVSTRPDPSDAGMAYFAVTGDENCDPQKLKHLIEDHSVPVPVLARKHIRLEAENFRYLDNFKIDDTNDKGASHRLQVAMLSGSGSIRTRFDEPFSATAGQCDVEIRFMEDPGAHGKYTLKINGAARGSWEPAGEAKRWASHTISKIDLRTGDELSIVVEGGPAKLDYVELNYY